MYKKFEVNQTKIKGGCQWERKAAEMISYSKMPLAIFTIVSAGDSKCQKKIQEVCLYH